MTAPLGMIRLIRATSITLLVAVGVAPGKAQQASSIPPLAKYAPAETSAVIKAVSLSSSATSEFAPAAVGTELQSGVKNVVLWYRWAGAKNPPRIEVQWSRGRELILTQWEVPKTESGETSWFLARKGGKDLPPGRYQVTVIEDGMPVTGIPFRINAKSRGTKAK